MKCAHGHDFEGWFANSADYDRQSDEKALECPVCGSADVSKALMAPAVATSRRREATATAKLDAMREAWNEAAGRVRRYVEDNFENVGKRFPEEARKIHYGEAPEKPIFGQASPEDVKELKEEGVEIAPVPVPMTDPDTEKTKLN